MDVNYSANNPYHIVFDFGNLYLLLFVTVEFTIYNVEIQPYCVFMIYLLSHVAFWE